MTHCTACRATRPQSARLLSLFDSLGPIMSGPSSSHTAGMARIGRMGRSLVGGTPERITLHFFGALSHTYKGHASDSAVVAGLIGEREDSPNVRHALRLAAERGVEVEIRTHPDSGRNPNTVSMELVRGGRTYAVAGVSVGGGEIEMTELEGFPVCLRGNEDGALFIGPDGLGRAVFEERLGALSGFSCVKDGERALYLCLAEKPFPDGIFWATNLRTPSPCFRPSRRWRKWREAIFPALSNAMRRGAAGWIGIRSVPPCWVVGKS